MTKLNCAVFIVVKHRLPAPHLPLTGVELCQVSQSWRQGGGAPHPSSSLPSLLQPAPHDRPHKVGSHLEEEYRAVLEYWIVLL